jgi:hypothetical protein
MKKPMKPYGLSPSRLDAYSTAEIVPTGSPETIPSKNARGWGSTAHSPPSEGAQPQAPPSRRCGSPSALGLRVIDTPSNALTGCNWRDWGTKPFALFRATNKTRRPKKNLKRQKIELFLGETVHQQKFHSKQASMHDDKENSVSFLPARGTGTASTPFSPSKINAQPFVPSALPVKELSASKPRARLSGIYNDPVASPHIGRSSLLPDSAENEDSNGNFDGFSSKRRSMGGRSSLGGTMMPMASPLSFSRSGIGGLQAGLRSAQKPAAPTFEEVFPLFTRSPRPIFLSRSSAIDASATCLNHCFLSGTGHRDGGDRR